jgi:hypothetical protein
VLVPDFRGRQGRALETLAATPPDVLNHNLETVPRLYREARPGADYAESLALLREFGARCPGVPTKSGLMLGLGESDEEVEVVLSELRANGVSRLTLGQYLRPSPGHLPVQRYVTPERFAQWSVRARELGFAHASCGPLVRSSYHAETQAESPLAVPPAAMPERTASVSGAAEAVPHAQPGTARDDARTGGRCWGACRDGHAHRPCARHTSSRPVCAASGVIAPKCWPRKL